MIKVQSIETEHLKLMPYSMLDDEFVAMLHENMGYLIQDDSNRVLIKNTYKSRIKEFADDNTAGWVCWSKNPLVRIGFIYYTNVSPTFSSEIHQIVDFKAYKQLIAQRNGNGRIQYMDEATKASINYMFKAFKLQRITGSVVSLNKFAVSMFTRLGFKQEGLVRKATRIYNNAEDVVVMGLLKEDYANLL